ncbi:helix-hairpin-helix domain-containing protein [Geofilum rubicundum]
MESLMLQFRSLSGIKSATLEELTGVVGAARAKAIVEFFSKEETQK